MYNLTSTFYLFVWQYFSFIYFNRFTNDNFLQLRTLAILPDPHNYPLLHYND